MKNTNKKGFSLFELLAVFVIIGILLLIATPLITGIIDRMKVNANKANIVQLNESTRLYVLGEHITSNDAFLGFNTDSERISILFQLGYLDQLAQPSYPYASYEWNIDIQTWELGNLVNAQPSSSIYIFDSTRLIDMITYGSTIPSGSFADQGDSLKSSYGLMYIPNPNETYTLTVKAQITEAGTTGGYGILFDTTANDLTKESDTGFALQIDRGYANGEIIIRPRINGKEKNPVYRYPVKFDALGQFTTSGGTKDNQNAWWMEIHTIEMVVSIENLQNHEKSISLYVDGQFLFEYIFVTTVFGETALSNLTGFRLWNSDVSFYELSIT